MQRSRAESHQRDPLSIQLRDVAQRLTHQDRIVQGMLLFEQPIKLSPFAFAHQPHDQPLQNIGFVSKKSENHPAIFRTQPKKVQSFFVWPNSANMTSLQMN